MHANRRSRGVRSNRQCVFVFLGLIFLCFVSFSLLLTGGPSHPDDALGFHLHGKRDSGSAEEASVVDEPVVDPSTLPPAKILLYQKGGLDPNNWAGFGGRVPELVGDRFTKSCPQKCTFTTDEKDIATADAVLFQPQAPEPEKRWTWLREPVMLPHKRPGQLWAGMWYQTPAYYPLLSQPSFMEGLDITVSYEQSNNRSHVPISLFCNYGGDQYDLLKAPGPKSSDKLVAFVASNCAHGGAKARYEYVQELMKHVKVDSFGDCLHNKDLSGNKKGDLTQQLELLSEYKFVLAFESANVTDFVTERLMVAFRAGAVPVYMGAPNVDEWLPGDNSIIRTDQFKGPEDLARHLKSLDDNDAEYQKYFAWKKSGLKDRFKQLVDRCAYYNAECRLCQKVAQMKRRQPPLPDKIKNVPRYPANSYALHFDGDQNYVELGHYTAVSLSLAFTMHAWIFLRENGNYRIIDKGTAGRIDGYTMDILDKGSRSYLRICCSGGCWMGMKPLDIGNWYHVAIVFVSSMGAPGANWPAGISFYINGELDIEVPFPISMFGLQAAHQNDVPLRIGRAGRGDNQWKGMIDEVGLWSIPLSSHRIKRLIFEAPRGDEEGLEGYWNFDEGSGTVAHDLTGNKDGTVYGTVNGPWVALPDRELVLNPCA